MSDNTRDQYADMPFPTSGLDESFAFGAQRPGSTRQGVNVRAYDSLENRARGGSRAGVSRYIDGLVGGAHLIQHLNYVVDPQNEALPDYDPPGDITGGPNLLQPGPEGDGGYTDPTGSPRDTSGRRLRYGGTGARLSRTRKDSQIRFVQGNGGVATVGATSLAFTSSVAKNGLVLVAALVNVSNLANTVSVSDTRGNTWARAGNYSTGNNLSVAQKWALSLWYAVANAAGTVTVTVTPSDLTDTAVLSVAEYSGTKTSGVLDAAATNTEIGASGATYTATTGNVAVAGSREMVVGVFYPYDASAETPLSPFTGRTSTATALTHLQDHIGASGAEAATRSITIFGAVKFYVAVGASFKPKVP